MLRDPLPVSRVGRWALRTVVASLAVACLGVVALLVCWTYPVNSANGVQETEQYDATPLTFKITIDWWCTAYYLP